MLVRRLAVVLTVAGCLGACATVPETSFKLVDERTETRFGDARSTVQGADGPVSLREVAGELPFMLKILAADRPLSAAASGIHLKNML